MSPASLLKELIAIPSINPMGQDADGPEFFEGRMSDYLERWFGELGVEYRRIEVAPRRHNVVARYAGRPDRPVTVLDAHQDTVPVDGMTIPPFEPHERGGRLYGRGACDIKGGMAAMLTAFARIVRDRPAGCGDVIMSCTCDEEHGMAGIRDLVNRWNSSDSSDWMGRRPDAVIICEPTSLDIVVAHRGVVRWEITTSGRAVHSSRPSDGINAIYRMARIVSGLEEYADHLERTGAPHPLCGTPTLSVGRIGGGISVNVVPDSCRIEIDRRVLPGEDASRVMPDVDTWLRERVDVDFEMRPPWCVVEPLSDARNGDLADRLLHHVASVAGPRRKTGVAYGTNAAAVDAAGIPAVVFGPGSIDQAHTKDEWIEIEQLDLAAEILVRFLSDAGERSRIGS